MTNAVKRTAGGAVRSKTNWIGLTLILLTYFQGNLARFGLSGDNLDLVYGCLGALIIVNRFFTTKPLSER